MDQRLDVFAPRWSTRSPRHTFALTSRLTAAASTRVSFKRIRQSGCCRMVRALARPSPGFSRIESEVGS
ncbi:MAG: hypothetical protein K1X89_30540, partial [Myxococcaceae bacterium]|nr:hypothetical protein [Myxococcaceae bacterium]